MCVLFHKCIEQQPARHHIAFPIEDMKNIQIVIEKQVQNLRAGLDQETTNHYISCHV
jgi:hypothetical protein